MGHSSETFQTVHTSFPIFVKMNLFNGATNKTALDRFMSLNVDHSKRTQCMYIWIDGTGGGLRAKTRTVDFVPQKPGELPIWNSDVYLYPVALYRDPFRLGDHKLVMCETYKHNKLPADTNHRKTCNEVMERAKDHKPWF